MCFCFNLNDAFIDLHLLVQPTTSDEVFTLPHHVFYAESKQSPSSPRTKFWTFFG